MYIYMYIWYFRKIILSYVSQTRTQMNKFWLTFCCFASMFLHFWTKQDGQHGTPSMPGGHRQVLLPENLELNQ